MYGYKECIANQTARSVNLAKTKAMVFQKRNKHSNKCNFIYNNRILEIVLHYTYLGIKISGSGDFTKATEVLSSKAKNALAALRKKIALETLPFDITIRLFNSFCLPIYTYGCEVWRTGLVGR